MSRDSYDDWTGPRTRRHSGGHARNDDSWSDEQDPYGQAGSQYGQDPYGQDGYQQDDGYGSYSQSGPYSQPGGYDQQDGYGQADQGGQDPYYGQADSGGGPYDGGYDNSADPYQGGYSQYADGGGDYYNGRGDYDSAGGDPYANGYGSQRGYDSGGYNYPGQGYQDPEPVGRAPRRSRAQEAPPRQRQRGRSGRRGDPFDDRHSEFFSGFSDDVDEPRRRRFPVGLLALFIIMAVLGGIAGVGYHYYSLYKTRHLSYSGNGTGTVDITVPKGATGDTIAPMLVSKGVIGSVDSFASFVATKAANLQPGEFKLHHHMGNAQAWAILTNPKDAVNPSVTIVDGEPSFVYLPKLAKKTGIPLSKWEAAFHDTAKLGLPAYAHGNAEGFIYPDTYDFTAGKTTPLQILQDAVKAFKSNTAALNLAAVAHHDGYTNLDHVIIEASLLEGEVGPKYFAQVATVIDNRINHGVPSSDLQLDSTVAFAVRKFTFNLTNSQLQTPSPYNTFLHPGLPPGPINSPDAAAIEAVLHPKVGPWTYFVTVNKKGLTMFTTSGSQFTTWSNEAKANGV